MLEEGGHWGAAGGGAGWGDGVNRSVGEMDRQENICLVFYCRSSHQLLPQIHSSSCFSPLHHHSPSFQTWTPWMYLFLPLIFISFFKEQRWRQTGLSSTDPLHKCLQQPGLGPAQARNPELTARLLHGWWRPKHLIHHLGLPGAQPGLETQQSDRGCWDPTRCLKCCAKCSPLDLTLISSNLLPSPLSGFFTSYNVPSFCYFSGSGSHELSWYLLARTPRTVLPLI